MKYTLTKRQAKAKNFDEREVVISFDSSLVKEKYHGCTFYGIGGSYCEKTDSVRLKKHTGWPHRFTVIMPRLAVHTVSSD